MVLVKILDKFKNAPSTRTGLLSLLLQKEHFLWILKLNFLVNKISIFNGSHDPYLVYRVLGN